MLFRLPAAAVTLLALAACAAPPPVPDEHTPLPLEIDLHATLPAPERAGEPLMASRLGIGASDDLLSYDASYAVEPGAAFTQTSAPPGVSPAQHMAAQALGSQRIGQDLRMRLPMPAGAPVALQLSAELQEQWKADGSTVARQSQVARLAWSPGPARLELQWHGGAVDNDAGLALGCDLRGRLEMPLGSAGDDSSPALGVYGRDCQVMAGHPDYQALAAASWGMALRWDGHDRETRLSASMVDPRWELPSRQELAAGYELGMSHRRAYGAWSAESLLAMRYATAWDLPPGAGVDTLQPSAGEYYWTAGISLTHQLPALSVTARWSHGADPAWFMPVFGERKHQLDLRLDFSRAIATLVPQVRPQLAMEWHWSEARSRANEITAQSAVQLNMGVGW